MTTNSTTLPAPILQPIAELLALIALASFLVAAQSELVIDVSCVERGRWRRQGRGGFGASGEVVGLEVIGRPEIFASQPKASQTRGPGPPLRTATV